MAQAAGITAAVAILFYRSILGLLSIVLVGPFWLKLYRKEQEEKLHAKKQQEFKEFMMLIASNLQAGYSIERAIKQSEGELYKLFGKESVLLFKIHEMNQKIGINTSVEKAFADFAHDISLEEAENLAEILSYSKRSGGDYCKQIQNTAAKIESRLLVEQEIETITTEKRLELKVMSLMPMGILAYISLTSSEFINVLYTTALGKILMTVCLIAYGGLIILGQKIIAIKV